MGKSRGICKIEKGQEKKTSRFNPEDLQKVRWSYIFKVANLVFYAEE